MTIPIARWGKDHWSTFAYLETLAVDHNGLAVPVHDRMRTDHDRHPHLVGHRAAMFGGLGTEKYPTQLAGGELAENHDDWDCVDDAVAEGLLEDFGTGMAPAYRFTKVGRAVAAKLRCHKQAGGTFSTFGQPLNTPAA